MCAASDCSRHLCQEPKPVKLDIYLSLPQVLTFVSYYLPGYKAGGPLRSISNLVEALKEDLTFSIVTRDRDLGDSAPYTDILADAWLDTPHGRVNYRSPAAQRLRPLARLMRETPHDVLYLNSIFDIRFAAQPLLARRLGLAPSTPVVIAPRGELAAGALALKGKRKAAYLKVASSLGLFDHVLWMASSPREAQDIERSLGVASEHIAIASDLGGVGGSDAPLSSSSLKRDSLQLVFLARISPMKNLDYALELLREVDVPVAFDVFGPCSDAAYLDLCRSLSTTMPDHVKVRFLGEVRPEEVGQTLASYDLMLLPSRGENFGHVILESLQAGTPVLISDRTPWSSTPDEACLAIPLERPEEFRQVIRQRAMIRSSDRARLRKAARLHGTRFGSDPGHLAANRDLFLRAASGHVSRSPRERSF